METSTVTDLPKDPVYKFYVDHGKVFGNENWYTFYCGWCQGNVYGSAKKCEHCGAILKGRVKYTEK